MRRYPAFLLGLYMLLGSSFALCGRLELFIPYACLLATFRPRLGSFLFFASFFFVTLSYDFPDEKYDAAKVLKIEAVTTSCNFYTHRICYRALFGHTPCLLTFGPKQQRPLANSNYLVQGSLLPLGEHHYLLKPKKWEKISSSWNWAEWRYSLKQKAGAHLHKKIPNQRTATFLTTLFTGDGVSPALRFYLSRLGLQHILAISGFHFAIIAFLLALPFKGFLSPKVATVAALFFITLYFLFVGPSSSIMRAWISSSLFLLGRLIARESSALNRLGVALMILLLANPLVAVESGFLLSFAATVGILLFYPFAARLFKVTRVKQETLSFASQGGLFLLSFLRNALALQSAVAIMILPLCLYLFHQVPLLSFLYNLIIPCLIIPSLGLLLCALFLDLILPALGSLIHVLNSYYTTFLLSLITDIPPHLDYRIIVPHLPFIVPMLCATVVIAIGLFLQEERDDNLLNYL